jgi:hypothetical protein
MQDWRNVLDKGYRSIVCDEDMRLRSSNYLLPIDDIVLNAVASSYHNGSQKAMRRTSTGVLSP